MYREGLSTRSAAGSEEIQLRIDPMHGDLDEEIGGLRKQVRQLRNVSFTNSLETSRRFSPFGLKKIVDLHLFIGIVSSVIGTLVANWVVQLLNNCFKV